VAQEGQKASEVDKAGVEVLRQCGIPRRMILASRSVRLESIYPRHLRTTMMMSTLCGSTSPWHCSFHHRYKGRVLRRASLSAGHHDLLWEGTYIGAEDSRVTACGGTNESGMIWYACVGEVTSTPTMEPNGSTGCVGIGRLIATLEGIGGKTRVGIGLKPEAGVTVAPRFVAASAIGRSGGFLALGSPPSLSAS
jgi:hypothetical protein